MSSEMIEMMIDALVESVLVVMSVEVREFDIGSKQQDRYVGAVVAGGRRRGGERGRLVQVALDRIEDIEKVEEVSWPV